jgi:hypothetical protein
LVKASEQVYKKQMVYDEQKAQSVASAQISLPEDKEHPPMVSEPPSTDASGKQPDSYTQSPAAAIVPECGGFYDLFLRRFREVTTKAPLTVDEMLLYLDVCKTQLNDWLKRALEDGQAKKLSKPVRYQWQSQKPRQPSIFDDKKQVEY